MAVTTRRGWQGAGPPRVVHDERYPAAGEAHRVAADLMIEAEFDLAVPRGAGGHIVLAHQLQDPAHLEVGLSHQVLVADQDGLIVGDGVEGQVVGDVPDRRVRWAPTGHGFAIGAFGPSHLLGPRVGHPPAVAYQMDHREVDPRGAEAPWPQRRVCRVHDDVGTGGDRDSLVERNQILPVLVEPAPGQAGTASRGMKRRVRSPPWQSVPARHRCCASRRTPARRPRTRTGRRRKASPGAALTVAETAFPQVSQFAHRDQTGHRTQQPSEESAP